MNRGKAADPAIRAGVVTAESRRQKFGSRHHTFLTKRFDRTDTVKRIHFASAMTLLASGTGRRGRVISTSPKFLASMARSPRAIWSSSGGESCSSCASRTSTIISEVETVVKDWRGEAKKPKLSRAEQDRMARAFRVAR